MAISSSGYYGSVNDAQWAQLFEPLPHWFRPSSFVPTAVANARTVSLSVGVAFGAGVRDASDSAIPVPLAPPGSGGQWYLIVLRRIWSIGVSGVTTVQALPGPTTAGTVPTTPPSVLPASFQQTPSATDDAPVAWVHVRAADTTLTIFDARVLINGTGRGVAASAATLALLPLLAPLQVGLLLPNVADSTTYRWNGTAFRPWESDWVTQQPNIGGINGSFGQDPGYVSSARWRYRAGRFLFVGNFFFNGGASALAGTMSIDLPVPIDTTYDMAYNLTIKAFNASDPTNNVNGGPARPYRLDARIENNKIYPQVFGVTSTNPGQLRDVTTTTPFNEPWAQSDVVRWSLEGDPA